MVKKVAKKYEIYVVFGMPERDRDNNEVIYNSAAIIYPIGRVDSYRKLHLPFSEGNWAIRGYKPLIIDTEWGPIGVTICYDTYCFPELIRYYRAKGARLCLNLTACPNVEYTHIASRVTTPAYAVTNYVYIASSNLCGKDKQSYFHGGSCVIGPSRNVRGAGEAHTYIGKMFDTPDCEHAEMFLGTIDLSVAETNTDIPIFSVNPGIEEPDFRPELYKRMMEYLLDSGKWRINSSRK